MRPAAVALWFLVMAIVLITWGGIRSMLTVRGYEFAGPSMEPTYLHGDRVIMDQTAYGLVVPGGPAVATWNEPVAGDVVVLISPADGVEVIKRVIAVGGQTVEFVNGQTFIDGQPVARRLVGECDPNRQKDPDPTCRVYEEALGEVTFRIAHSEHWEDDQRPMFIPPSHVYVRGDHRDRSNDSTNPMIGAVPVELVYGRVAGVYWHGGRDE